MKYIDAEALKKEVDNFPNCYNGWSDTYDKAYIIGTIEEQPSIDIVKCKECKYFIDNLTEDDADEAYDACRWDWKKCIPKDDDFCSYGKREGE